MKYPRMVGALVALGSVTIASGAAAAPPKVKVRTHPFSGDFTVTTLLSQTGSPPEPGARTRNTGTVTSRQWGAGKLAVRAIFGNATAPAAYPISGTASFAFKKGRLRFTFKMLATWQNPAVFIGGSAHVTGGTGAFTNTKGSFTFKGSSPLVLSPADLTYTGSLSY